MLRVRGGRREIRRRRRLGDGGVRGEKDCDNRDHDHSVRRKGVGVSQVPRRLFCGDDARRLARALRSPSRSRRCHSAPDLEMHLMRLLLISSSNVHGYGYLDHAEPAMRAHFGTAKRIAFIPYAAHDYAAYTHKVGKRLALMDYEVIGDDFTNADAVFVGGGNTF